MSLSPKLAPSMQVSPTRSSAASRSLAPHRPSWLSPWAAALLLGCSSVPSPLTPASAPAREASRPASEPVAPLPALSSEEVALSAALRADVKQIVALTCPTSKSGKARGCGRNSDAVWELAEVADWLGGQLEAAGFRVSRHGIELDGATVLNLDAEVPGGYRGAELVVVGAHYDAVTGSPGADDNASGVAGVLALARSFHGRRHQRSLRFVLFVNEEPPHFQTPTMGSFQYAKALSEAGRKVYAMLSLESIGYFSEAPKSQKFPTAALAEAHPPVGNFIGVLGDEQSGPLVTTTARLMGQHASLPVEHHVLPIGAPGVDLSDHWSFGQFGFPAAMVTDTAMFRNPHYHKATDTPESLDYDRMARVVSGVEAALVELAGGPYLD